MLRSIIKPTYNDSIIIDNLKLVNTISDFYAKSADNFSFLPNKTAVSGLFRHKTVA